MISTPSKSTALAAVLAFLWGQATPFVKARLGWALVLLMIAAAMTALGPVALQLIVDKLTGHSTSSWPSPLVLAALFALSQWLGRTTGEIRGLTYARAERRMSRMLAKRVFGHVIRLPFRFHVERQTTGAVTQILINGRLGYQMVLHTLVFTILPVVTEVAIMVVVLSRQGQPKFLLLFCTAVGLYALAFVYAARRIMTASRLVSSEQVQANMAIADSIENFETIMCCTGEFAVEAEVDDALRRTEAKEVHFYELFAVNGIGVATIYAGFLAATFWYAIYQQQAGHITIGTLVLVTSYMVQIVRPVESLGYAVQSLSQGVAYLEAMLDVLRETPAGVSLVAPGSRTLRADEAPLVGPTKARQLFSSRDNVGRPSGHPVHPLHATAGEVRFENVSCSYRSDRAIIQNVSFQVPCGTTVGIVGASGSGKSTLGRLLLRLIEPDNGRILLDGVAISEISLTELRRSVAVVPQDIALFSKTIFYNIAFGMSVSTQADVEGAARVAQLHDFIMSLPEGYNTQVGQRGLKLSGGEKQRLAIARAAIRFPRVWVFDEATSALDGPTQKEILSNLRESSHLSTAVVIAHRLSAVAHADEILVLDSGVIIERGTHDVLLQQNSRYAQLWLAQQHGPLAA
jgi:ATP-binding cassette subfamily B protein